LHNIKKTLVKARKEVFQKVMFTQPL